MPYFFSLFSTMKNKKGEFSLITSLLIGFIGFVLVTLMVIFILAQMKSTTLVCGNDPNGLPTSFQNGACLTCPSTAWVFNTTGTACCNATGGTANCLGANTTASVGYSGASYNATQNLMQAAILPPQFASLIVIVCIVVGILSLLALIGFNAYQRMKN